MGKYFLIVFGLKYSIFFLSDCGYLKFIFQILNIRYAVLTSPCLIILAKAQCGANSTCVNDLGGFRCECDDGYSLDSGSCRGATPTHPTYPPTHPSTHPPTHFHPTNLPSQPKLNVLCAISLILTVHETNPSRRRHRMSKCDPGQFV